MKTLIALAVGLLAFASFGATEYFADAKNGNDAWDGASATHEEGTDHGPKLSIQAAVDLAQVGSTAADMNIVTLAPGDYTNGVTGVTSGGVVSSNRVVIAAPIRLRSSGGRTTRDTTRIVGQWDLSGAADTKYCMGPRAIRCVWVENSATGTRLEGLTFLNGGATWGGDGGDHSHSTGGGGVVYNNYGGTDMFAVDCAFVNCNATRGGGLYNGSAVRCLFTRCRCSKFGCAARSCALYNCVVADNMQCPGASEGSGAFCYNGITVNCTFVGNELGGITADSKLNDVYNCVSVLNAGAQIASTFNPKNCVVSGTRDACTSATANEIFSPATGDYRLSAGAASLTAGDAQWLEKIPAEFRDTDYYGNPRKTGGVVYAGAVQAVATPVGAKLTCTPQASPDAVGYFAVNGHVCVRELYEQGETWPRMVKLSWVKSPVGNMTRGLVRFVQSVKVSDKTTETSVWPLRDGTAWVLAPQDETQKVGYYFQSGVVEYVDPTNGSDDTATNDGSAAKPWKTLQKAVTRADGNDRALIIARKGDYNEGGLPWQDVTNRVYVAAVAAIRVLAEEGPAATFITGAADLENPVDGNTDGLGPAAVRCVAVDNGCTCAFQGFTLRDGHSSMKSGNGDCAAAHGAAFLNGKDTMNYKTGWLLDCVVTNCTASRGPASYSGVAERTLFVGNRANRLGVFRYADLRSCLVRDNPQGGVLADVSYAHNTTFTGNGGVGVSNGHVYNCIVYGNPSGDINPVTERNYWYSLYGTLTSSSVPESRELVQDVAGFADAASGDFRLNSASAAVNLGSIDCLKSAMDFTGRPFAVTADGRVNAGAFAETVPGVRVAPNAVAGTKMSTLYAFGESDSVTVTLPGGAYGRALCGIVVGGATQTVSSATVTVSKEQAMAGAPYVMNPIYLSHFYVDVNGSDEADGGSEATAFQTLAKASSVARVAGDVVTVLPGTYDEKTIKVEMADHGWDAAMKVLCRLAVYPGVTFESRDGAEATVVKGASATGTVGVDVDANGCGTNGAVRCAFVGDGGVLRGFTLSGGRTRNGNLPADGSEDKQGVDFCCAGVLAPSSYNANQADQWSRRLVENCIFDDCYAPRAGVARCVLLRNCKITKCRGVNLGPTVRECRLENCLVTGNYSGTIYNCPMFNCTLDTNVNRGSGYDYPIVNCAFISKGTQTAGAFTNCAFKTGSTVTGANVNPRTVDYFKLDDNSCPTAISPLRDAGDRTLLPEGCVTDLWGNQRVYNAQVDIGCCEYDWRGDYAAALGSRKLTVDSADSDVTLADATTVSLPKGELTATWRTSSAGAGAPYSFVARVTGTGTLTVTRKGAEGPVAVIAAGDAQTISFNSPDETTQLAFAYQPGENDTGVALLSGFKHSVGTMILVR